MSHLRSVWHYAFLVVALRVVGKRELEPQFYHPAEPGGLPIGKRRLSRND